MRSLIPLRVGHSQLLSEKSGGSQIITNCFLWQIHTRAKMPHLYSALLSLFLFPCAIHSGIDVEFGQSWTRQTSLIVQCDSQSSTRVIISRCLTCCRCWPQTGGWPPSSRSGSSAPGCLAALHLWSGQSPSLAPCQSPRSRGWWSDPAVLWSRGDTPGLRGTQSCKGNQ